MLALVRSSKESEAIWQTAANDTVTPVNLLLFNIF